MVGGNVGNSANFRYSRELRFGLAAEVKLNNSTVRMYVSSISNI